MPSHAELIQTFYTSFQTRDAEGMIACYHPEVTFSDPVFGRLRGLEAASMWRMLCERGKDLQITFSGVRADETTGSAHWEAIYTFSKAKRRVHNVIEASFVFQDGKIIRHDDRFDLWKWSAMALGPLGRLLGWTRFLRFTIRKDARKSLEAFMAKQESEQ